MIDVALLLLAAVVCMATAPDPPPAPTPKAGDAPKAPPAATPPAGTPPAAPTPTGEIPEPGERGGGLPEFIPGEDHPAGEPLEKVPEPAAGAGEPAPTPTPPAPAKPPEVEVKVPEFLQEPAAGAPPAAPPAAPPPPPPAAPQPDQGLGIFSREQLLQRGRAVYGDAAADASPEEIAAHEKACLNEGLQQEQWAFTVAARTVRAMQQGQRDTEARTTEQQQEVTARRNRNSGAMREEFYRLTPELAHVRDTEAEPLLLALAAKCLAEAGVQEVADITREQYVKVLPLIRTDALAAFGQGAFRTPTVPPGAQPTTVEATGVVEQHTPGFTENPGGGPTVPPNLDTKAKGDPDLADFDKDQLGGRPDLRRVVRQGS